VDYIDFVLIKAGALVFLAFVWGLFCGFTGRQLSGEPLDKGPAKPGP
jgi:hypothetical protein